MRASASGGLILAIESSCDETAAAVVRGGRETVSNVVASQMALHASYGGVVPELASREHLRNIVPVVRAAMVEAGVGFAELDAIAVTEGPGLAGALLVGITYAKALALGLGKPLIAVNHLEGHIHAVLMEQAPGIGDGPLVALVVSGGHTHLYLAECPGLSAPGDPLWHYRNVGRTVDDAAGEAFDKVAKLLGLGYPGGPWLDALAAAGDPRAVEFRFGEIKARGVKVEAARQSSRAAAALHPAPAAGANARLDSAPPPDAAPHKQDLPPPPPAFDFSFSGIKTAVLRHVQTHGMQPGVEARRLALAAMPDLHPRDARTALGALLDSETLDLIASFQFAVVGVLLRQAFAAAVTYGARGLVVSGGVAANGELRRRFIEEGARRGLRVAFPAVGMSTDNAAMIAAAAWGKFRAGQFAGQDLVAVPQLRLG